MPHVLLAWVRWAGRRRGQGEREITDTLDAVFNVMGAFTRAYRDPTEFGLDSALVARLLPDGDLEALPRRAFAFPMLHGQVGGTDLSTLSPADADDRRALLAGAHEAKPKPAGPARTTNSTWRSTWTSRTGCGAVSRPACGPPLSGSWTRTRIGTWCCTC